MMILKKVLYSQLFRSFLVIAILFVVTACNHQSKQITDDTSDATTGFDSSIYVGKSENPMINWIAVNAGSFVFGSPEDTPCRAAFDENQSNVKLTHSFEMAATEVTQAQWQALGLKMPKQQVEEPDAPIVLISFFEVLQWVNALSQLHGLDTCYDLSSCKGDFGVGCEDAERGCGCTTPWNGGCEATPNIYNCPLNIHEYENYYECPGYRLPTTAEWEYAARSGTTTHTYNGDLKECIEGDTDYDDCSVHNFKALDSIAWFRENSGGTLHPVAQKQPNAWGFYDMLGNVLEWVDYYSDGQPLDMGDGHEGEDLTDPIGPKEGKNMDLRGQHFNSRDCYTRAARQYYSPPDSRGNRLGFRPVRTLFF